MWTRSNFLRCAAGVLSALLWAGPGRADDPLVHEGRYSEAFGVAIRVLEQRLKTRGALHPATVAALEHVGVVAHLGGDQRTADEALEASLAVRRRLPRDDAAMVRALIDRGRVARYRGRRPRAQGCFDEAERMLRAMPDPPARLRADLLQEQGDMARRTSFPAAIALHRDALAVRRGASTRPTLPLADTTTWLAWLLLRTGQVQEAVALTHEARGMLSALGLRDHMLGATLAGILADQEMLAGRPDRATPFLREEAAILTAARAKQLGGFPRRHFPLDGYEALAFEAVQRGRGEEAWTLLQRGRGAAHVDFATLALWERRDPHGFASARRMRGELQAATRQLVEMGGDPPAWTPATAPPFVRALKLRSELYDLARRYLQAHRPQVPTRAGVDEALGPRRALVGWLTAEVGELDAKAVPARSFGYAYVLRPGRPIVWVPLWKANSAEDYRQLTRTLFQSWDSIRRAASWRRHVAPDPEAASGFRDWGIQQFEPVLPFLLGVEHVVLERPVMPAELFAFRDGRALADMFDVSYVPSALVLELLAEQGSAAAPLEQVLAISGPADRGPASVASLVDMTEVERSHRQFRSSYTRDATPLERLPRLRYSGLEARAVGQKFPRRMVLTESGSTEPTLEQLAASRSLRKFGVVHLAGHTLTDSAPERCAVALGECSASGDGSNGLLEVEDMLLGWELDASLLTLSGCETMRAAGAERGEPLGFLPALFGSGARRILSSVWPVDDRATAILMDRFYENLTGGFRGQRLGYRQAPMPPARALREAKSYMRTLRDKHGRRPFEHPAYWGGFVLTGLP